MNEPGYYVAFEIPWEDERGKSLGCGPIETIGEIHEAWFDGIARLVMEGGDHAAKVPPAFHIFAVDEDGSGRDLNEVEYAAVVASLEQAFGGVQVSILTAGEEA